MMMVLLLILMGDNNTDSFNFKAKITDQTNDDEEINDVEIIVPLKYLKCL